MSYDADDAPPADPNAAPRPPRPPSDPRDPEAVWAALLLAAIELTDEPDTTFTRDQLVARACEIVGPEFPVLDDMVDAVLRDDGDAFVVGADGRLSLK